MYVPGDIICCVFLCVYKGVQVCARCSHVYCVCRSVCTCSAEGMLAECISVNGVRCLFVLSPGWTDIRKSMNGCG